MSSRPAIKPQPVFLPGNQDMSIGLTSLVTITTNLSLVGYGVSWAGTAPVGILTVQCSNDYEQNPDGTTRVAGTWNTMPFRDSTGTLVTSIAITGNTGNGFIAISDFPAYAIRLSYATTSGVGTLSAFLTAKVQ